MVCTPTKCYLTNEKLETSPIQGKQTSPVTPELGVRTRNWVAGFMARDKRLEVVGVSLTAPVAELLTGLSLGVVVKTGHVL